MFPRLSHRLLHYGLLIAVAALLFLPNLGAPSLWDIDEGNNAEAAREMLERGDWIVPVFNYQLRVDKPALLYWLQILAYQVFGVGEFAARLPSALAGLGTLLVTYELGRRLFGPPAGLITGLVLASAGLFCASAHFANPDALLNVCTALTFLFFWQGYSRGSRNWFIPAGATAGLAVLAKGPVGLVLPAAVIALFLLSTRQLRRLLDRRLALGLLAFALVALPWYAWVAAETKGQFLRGFLWMHNVERFRNPMEHHGGPLYYYFVALAVGFAPWSVFLGPAVWHSVCQAKNPVHLFLWCWIAVYLLFFSLSGTKLPNYILPLYPPVALVTASFLDDWRRDANRLPAWPLHASLGCLAGIGIATAVAFAVAGGVLDVPLVRGRRLPGLEAWAVLGILPLAGACSAWWCARRQDRNGLVACVASCSVLFSAGLLAGGSLSLDGYKAPRPLADALRTAQTEPEIRVACYHYFQPSLVFYCRREVARLSDENTAVEFLRNPLPAYLVVPAADWDSLKGKVQGACRELARHYELYHGCDVVLVTNR
jgi:4-amino-4-deoxy-L-arabinose transferase-like glycosyltransferase